MIQIVILILAAVLFIFGLITISKKEVKFSKDKTLTGSSARNAGILMLLAGVACAVFGLVILPAIMARI
ncbi:MAG: hypothetical protein AAF750_14730 [Planctomycetota bacterium]